MALVTIQRSPSPSTDPDLDTTDSSEDVAEGRTQLRKRSRTTKEKLRKILSTVRFISKLRPCLSDSYFTVKGAALILPHTECSKKTSRKSHGGEIQSHLQAMLHLLRPEDKIKIAVRLEESLPQYHRYIALVSTHGRQDTEEAVVLGIDCTATEALIGLVLPVWMGLRIKLGGDGGFSLCTDEQAYLFKPVSVQAMWSAIQSLVKVVAVAEEKKYILDGLTHTWVGYYRSRIDHNDKVRMHQWNVEGVDVFAPSSLSINSDDENEAIKLSISQKLKEVMMVVDLDEATSIMLRNAVEEKLGISLKAFKKYFDEEVMRILGQMDEPAKILDYLYLGSEWNASNLEELKEKGIGYILNVTREIDNFFMGTFQYFNVRLRDVEESDLLRHWDKTYKFISKARDNNSKVLVHCKMGISRSASTVMAYLMKENRWCAEEAHKFVKERRSCVRPNAGFMEQLDMYEGILTASNKRDIFRYKSDQNLLEDASKEELESSQGSFLGDSLFHVMSHSEWPVAAGGVAHEEEWLRSLESGSVTDRELLQLQTDLETESRSADSMEEALPDLPSPHPSSDESHTTAAALPTVTHARDDNRERCLPPGAMDSTLLGRDLTTSDGDSTIILGPSRIRPDSSWIKPESFDVVDGLISEEHKDFIDCQAGQPAPPDSSHLLEFCANTQPGVPAVPPSPGGVGTETTSAPIRPNPAPVIPCSGFNPTPSISTPSSSIVFPSTCASAFSKFSCRPELVGDVPSRHLTLGQHNNSDTKIGYTPDVVSSLSSQPPDLPLSLSIIAAANRQIVGTIKAMPPAGQGHTQEGLHQGHNPSVSKTSSSLPEPLTCHDEPRSLERGQATIVRMDREGHGQVDTLSEMGNISPGNSVTAANSQNPRPKIEVGVRQYFLKEQIPWNPGKVQKIREGINKTGHIFNEDEVGGEANSGSGNNKIECEEEQTQWGKKDRGTSSDRTLLDSLADAQPNNAGLSQSQSCVELCSQAEADPYSQTLYQKEEIPLEPGTVLRTRLEIEERQRLFWGDGDQESDFLNRPILRTRSFKQERDVAKFRHGGQRRRTLSPTMSPISGKSLDDLRLAGAEDEAMLELRKLSSSSRLKDRKGFESKRGSDRTPPGSLALSDSSVAAGSGISKAEGVCSPNSRHTVAAHSYDSNATKDRGQVSRGDTRPTFHGAQTLSPTSSQKQPETKGNFDSKTLALIREIGSALLMSPSPQDPGKMEKEETGSNMVKYFVRKIEKQSNPVQPARNIILIDSEIPADSSPGCTPPDRKVPSRNLSVELKTPPTDVAQTLSTDIKHLKLNSGSLEDTGMRSNSRCGASTLTSGQTETDGSFLCEGGNTASEMSEPSVVKHLVGRFEIGSSEQERLPSEQGQDFCLRSKGVKGAASSHSLVDSPGTSQREPAASTNQFVSSQQRPSSNLPSPHASGHCLPCPSSSPELPPSSSLSTFSSSSPGAGTQLPNCGIDQPQEGGSRNGFNIPVELLERSSGADHSHLTECCSPDPRPPGPTPFSKHSMMMAAQNKTWRSVRPKSAEHLQRSPSLDCRSKSSEDWSDSSEDKQIPIGHTVDNSNSAFATFDTDTPLRQVSDEGRKIRRLHGKSHPLTKLSQNRVGSGPFHSSM